MRTLKEEIENRKSPQFIKISNKRFKPNLLNHYSAFHNNAHDRPYRLLLYLEGDKDPEVISTKDQTEFLEIIKNLDSFFAVKDLNGEDNDYY